MAKGEKITEKLLLEQLPVNELDLFKRYTGIPNISLRGVYKNPIYKGSDTKPSFNLFRATRGTNEVIYKDWGNGGSSGNIFGFMAKFLGLNYYEALCRVANDYGIEFDTNEKLKAEKGNSVFTPVLVDKTINDKELVMRVERLEWSYDTLKYYLDLGIKQNTLELCNIYPIYTVFIDGELKWYSTKTDPIYGTFVYSTVKRKWLVKMKRPLVKDPNYKWKSSLTSDLIMLFNCIKEKKVDLLILSKSSEDGCFCISQDEYAVAFQSESLVTELIVFIPLLRKHAKKIVTFYDNDEVGRKYAALIEDTYDIPSIEVPQTFDKCKDITDVARRYGVNTARKLLKNLLLPYR